MARLSGLNRGKRACASFGCSQSQSRRASCATARSAGGKKLFQVGVHKYGRAIIVRGVRLHAAVREFRLAGRQKAHNSREIVISAHEDERANVRRVARIARGQQRKSARETYSHDGHRARAEPLLQPCGRFADRADRSAVDVIVRESRDLRGEHRKSVARGRAREIHEPRLVDPQMMNPVDKNHARRMGDSARHIEPGPHRALRCGKRDFLRIESMPFKPHQQSGSVRIEKLIQKNVAAQLVAKRVDCRRRAEESRQRNPQEFETHGRAIQFDRCRIFKEAEDRACPSELQADGRTAATRGEHIQATMENQENDRVLTLCALQRVGA